MEMFELKEQTLHNVFILAAMWLMIHELKDARWHSYSFNWQTGSYCAVQQTHWQVTKVPDITKLSCVAWTVAKVKLNDQLKEHKEAQMTFSQWTSASSGDNVQFDVHSLLCVVNWLHSQRSHSNSCSTPGIGVVFAKWQEAVWFLNSKQR